MSVTSTWEGISHDDGLAEIDSFYDSDDTPSRAQDADEASKIAALTGIRDDTGQHCTQQLPRSVTTLAPPHVTQDPVLGDCSQSGRTREPDQS